MDIGLGGRTALVTGGSGGIGRAIVEALARAGARTVSLDNRVDPGEAQTAALDTRLAGCIGAGAVSFVAADLAEPVAAAGIVRAEAAKLGGFDIVINNAAINPLKPVDGYDLAEFERVQRINAHSAVALVQACVADMKRKRRGAIVNICSITLNGGWKDFTAYVASKGTLLGLTRSLARELGEWNIRVNAVSPGAIPTALEAEVWGDRIDSYNAFLLERQSLKYRGSAADVANLVQFLCSDAARFVTGQNVCVDGGWWMT